MLMTMASPTAASAAATVRTKNTSTCASSVPSDRLKAMALAGHYGTKLYTGVLYRNPEPPPTYEAEARARQQEGRALARPRHELLELFRPA